MIIICGLARTGKSTLAKRLKSVLPSFNLIVSEALRNGFQKIDEQHAKDWGNKNSQLRQEIFPAFAREFISWNEKFSKCNTIFDCALLNIKQVIDFAKDEDIVLCLGFGGRSNDEILDIIRSYEQNNDYTKNYNNETLIKLWGDISAIDKENLALCNKNNIKYFDTSNDRDNCFKTIIEYCLSALKMREDEE